MPKICPLPRPVGRGCSLRPTLFSASSPQLWTRVDATGNTVVVELLNSQKLMLEYEKYNELQAKSQRMQEDYENQMREMEKSKQGGLEELTEFYEGKLRETCARLEQVTTSALLTTLYKNYVLRIFVKWTHLLEYCCAFLLIYNQIKKEWNRILLKS